MWFFDQALDVALPAIARRMIGWVWFGVPCNISGHLDHCYPVAYDQVIGDYGICSDPLAHTRLVKYRLTTLQQISLEVKIVHVNPKFQQTSEEWNPELTRKLQYNEIPI